jgi:hypothetical protein
LQAWKLGADVLRARSHEELEKIWNSPRQSAAALGQDAAGGSRPHRVRRKMVHEKLQSWTAAAQNDAPAAIIGRDGVGKTWATLDWLIDRKAELPIVLVVPSSAAPAVHGISAAAVKLFLADRLYELTGVRDRDHWLHRLDRLLSRPSDEGPVLTVFFDGLNQESSIPWLRLLKIFQCDPFAGRIRVLVSTRTFDFETKLARFNGLIVPAVIVSMGEYDLSPGGELDQMLAFEGLRRESLPTDLIPLAQNPRLFGLVVSQRDRLANAEQVTIHQLLWEYGRDTFGVRAERSFSEDEWRAWLCDVAREHRKGIEQFSLKSVGEIASRPDLSENQIYARLSDIIDGQFMIGSAASGYQLAPNMVAHALGSALLAMLDVTLNSFDDVTAKLGAWLDPIAGLDQRVEILRAAVAIYVARGVPKDSVLGGALVTAWLQTQNLSDLHRRELAGLAARLPDALLDALEHSTHTTHASARLWAVNALRSIDRDNMQALGIIVSRTRTWNCVISRDTRAVPPGNDDLEKRRAQQFLRTVGRDQSGSLQVLGLGFQLVDDDDGILISEAVSILEGFPLALAAPVFEAAAVARTIDIRHAGWDKLKWLCLLNERDPEPTALTLRAASRSLQGRQPEPGVNASLPARAAYMMLLLTGQEENEVKETALDRGLDSSLTYEKNYLPNPGRSFFPLERRHAEAALSDGSLPLLYRADRCHQMWLDPTFEPPASYVAEIRAAAVNIDVEKLERHRGTTIEDHQFEQFKLVLARCAPDLLADLTRRKARSIATSPASSRYWCALRATDGLVLLGDDEAKAAHALRVGGQEKSDSEELFASYHLLIVEIQNRDARSQAEAIINAGLKFIPTDLGYVLRPLGKEDADALIDKFRSGTAAQQRDLVGLFGLRKVAFSEKAWAWLTGLAFESDAELQRFAYIALTQADAKRTAVGRGRRKAISWLITAEAVP